MKTKQQLAVTKYFKALDELEKATIELIQSGVTEESHNRKKQVLSEGIVTVDVKFKPTKTKNAR
jgi:hypothetical protein